MYNDELLQLSEGCEHPILRAGAWHWLAVVTPDPERTIAASEQGIIQARAAMQAPGPGPDYGLMADRDFLLAGNLVYYGQRLIDVGVLGRAVHLVAESITLFQAKGHLTGVADCLRALARSAQLTGDLDRARMLLDEAHRLEQSLVYRQQSPRNALMALVTLYQGDPQEARRLLHDSLQRCLELKERSYLAQIYTYLAECSLWEGEPAQAERWLDQSLFHVGDPQRATVDQLEHLCVAARLAAAQGADERAAELFGFATAVSRRLSYEPAEPMRSLNQIALAQVRATLGDEVFTEACARGLEQPIDAAYALLVTRSTPLSHGYPHRAGS
jgi:tetratricopeptide (TPR) repeat protein